MTVPRMSELTGEASKHAKRSPDHWFDVEQFVEHVEAYRVRWSLTRADLLQRAGINHQAGYAVLRGERTPSLGTVCALAEVCDLSLDKYRLSTLTWRDDV